MPAWRWTRRTSITVSNDLIVTLGGSLSQLGLYRPTTSQLPGTGRRVCSQAAARAMGLRHRLVHAPQDRNPFAQRVGESGACAVPKPARNCCVGRADSGAVVATFTRGKVAADLTGLFSRFRA